MGGMDGRKGPTVKEFRPGREPRGGWKRNERQGCRETKERGSKLGESGAVGRSGKCEWRRV